METQFLDEDVLDLCHAAAYLRELTGEPPSLPTLWRWAVKGGPHGVCLDHFRVGKRIYTSRQAVDRFLNATALAYRQAFSSQREAEEVTSDA